MPRSARAVSKDSLWPFVRNSTATSEGGCPSATSAAMRVATWAASSGSLSATTSSGAGPSGRWARSSTAPERRCPPGPRRTRLASDTTWGVER